MTGGQTPAALRRALPPVWGNAPGKGRPPRLRAPAVAYGARRRCPIQHSTSLSGLPGAVNKSRIL